MNDGPNQESMSGSRVCALTFLLVLGQATLLKVGLLREPRRAPLHPDSFQVHVSPEFAQYPIQSRGVSDDSQWVWKKGRNDSFSAGAIRLLPVDTYRADEAPPGIGWLPLSGIAFSEAPAKASVESKLDAPDGVVKQFELPKASEFKFRKETGVLLEGELAGQGLIEPIRPPSFVPARPLPPTWVEIAMRGRRQAVT